MLPSPEIDAFDVPVSGGSLAAFRLGTPERSGTPTVLAVHGITSNSRVWLPTARALGSRAGLIAVDLRGRGRSGGLSAPYGIGAHVQDLLAVLDRAGLSRAIVIGHSLGAYISARLAADHPERVEGVVMVDGGLPIPGTEHGDPQTFLDGLLGPALARLQMTFAERQAYRDWWRTHPAFAGDEIAPEDLNAYADHDLVGEEPAMRSGISEEAVRADAIDLFAAGTAAQRLALPAILLCAPRGLMDDPHPMQPLATARAWADADPQRRRARLVDDVNHYTITLGATGGRAVAEALQAIMDSVADRAQRSL